MKHAIRTISLAISVLAVSAPVLAGDISWIFQDTEIDPGPGAGAAMRGGYVWPVVFGQNKAGLLLPTGWHEVPIDLGESPRAISSPTGDVAAWSGGDAVVLSATGVTQLTADALAYDKQGRLWKVERDDQTGYLRAGFLGSGGWSYLPDITEYASGLVSIAVAVSGEVGVVTSQSGQMYYHHYSALLGSWTRSESLTDFGAPWLPDPSLVFDSRSIPHILGQDDAKTAHAYRYDVVFGQWRAATLPFGTFVDGDILPLAAASDGTVGTAFVSGDELYYAYRELDGLGWSAVQLPTGGPLPTSGPMPAQASAGLAYDYNGIPVIAYVAAGTNNIWLAYDPVQVPEPATAGLLALGGIALLRRRR